ncbi:hypothetical protein P9X10_02760 [Bacillus cereus]|nr:hypothetical protein [Bacillus cereus]
MTTISSISNKVEVERDSKRELIRQYYGKIRYTERLDNLVKEVSYREYNNLSYHNPKQAEKLNIKELQVIVKSGIQELLSSIDSIKEGVLVAQQLYRLGKLSPKELKLKTYIKYKVLVSYMSLDLSQPYESLELIIAQHIRWDGFYVNNKRPTSSILLDEENFGTVEALLGYLNDFSVRSVQTDNIILAENPHTGERELYGDSEVPHAWRRIEDITIKIIKAFQTDDLTYKDIDLELFLAYMDGVIIPK